MSYITILNTRTGERSFREVPDSGIVPLDPADRVEQIADRRGPATSTGIDPVTYQALLEREVEALETSARQDVLRNELHIESNDLSREHLAFVRDAQARHEELGGRILADIASPDPAPLVQTSSGGLEQQLAAVGYPEPPGVAAGAPWIVLRDPATAPAGWVNHVKVLHADRQAAAAAADELARKSGGRYLILGTTAYVEAASPTFHEGSPADPFDDLPF